MGFYYYTKPKPKGPARFSLLSKVFSLGALWALVLLKMHRWINSYQFSWKMKPKCLSFRFADSIIGMLLL
jgi:hypothetical protein